MSPRRFIVGVGVSKYVDETLNLAAVPGDVAKITGWFAQQSTVPHERALPELANSPTNQEIQSTLSLWLRHRDPEDFVIVYLAAHGEVEGGKAYVQGRDSPRERLAGVAIEGDTIGRIIGQSPPHNVLFIVDACVAGRLGSAIQRSAEDVADELNTRDPHRTWSQAVVCSTFSRDPAFDGKFAEAFINVVTQERWTGTSRPYIDFDLLMTGLNAELKELKVAQVAERKVWGPGAAELIPNPNYGARQPSRLLIDEELASHFDPSSRGVTRGESGWYFIGRHEELARISAWLAGSPGPGAPSIMVVTGSPGSGKSALISRVIMLSDPALRARVPDLPSLPPNTIPPLSSIATALWCHNKTLEQFVADLGGRLGINARTPAALLDAIRTRSSPLTIAVDALDEAVEGHSTLIATEVLVPLTAIDGVRVLVATRPHPVREADGTGTPTSLLAALRVDPNDRTACVIVDQAANRAADLREYVTARLLATGDPGRRTPYSDHAELAARVAERVATAAGTSFLVAAVTARTLAARNEAVNPDELVNLPTEAGAALGHYISRLEDPQAVLDVLRPLAWAEGAGLPWGPMWAPLATALARAARPAVNVTYSDVDIAAVLRRASDLVVEGSEWDQPVYRLFHVALAEHLRSDLAPAQAQQAMAASLETIVGGPPYQNVPAYALAYATTHLAQAPGHRERLYALATSPEWERAKRDRFGDATGFLRDVDLAIAAAKAEPRDLAAVAGACLVYARQMAIAPAPVVSVIAKSGQLQRAELMAGNIAFAVERCWAYALIAPTLHAERDLTGALRCLGEAERAIGAINVTHAPMAWAWIAEASMACGLPERAFAAARQAAEMRTALTESTNWELSNVYFWAGLAARHAGDESTRTVLRTEFTSRVERIWRNQELQATAVLGDTDRLREVWNEWMTGGRGGMVRDGNLALALADAGMVAEVGQMLDVIGREELGPASEADSRKHLVWALAIAGRFDGAFSALSTIKDLEHWARALGRIVSEAQKRRDAKAGETATDLVSRIDYVTDQRTKTILVPILHDLQQHERALLFAEEIVREGVEPTAMSSVAFPEPDDTQPGSRPASSNERRKKTARRHLRTEIASLADESAANDVIALVRAGKLDEARAKLSSITVPRFRWTSLREIAAATDDAALAIDLWCDALLEARHVNEAAAHSTVAILAARLPELPDGDAQGERIAVSARAVTKAWTEAEIAAQYELLRELFRSGRTRTRRMEELIAAAVRLLSAGGPEDAITAAFALPLELSMRQQSVPTMIVPQAQALLWGVRFALSTLWTAEDVDALIASGEAGQRIFAIVLMESQPTLATVDRVIRLITSSLSAFEQYHALVVGVALAPRLSSSDGARLRAAIAQERTRYITPETDRYRLTTVILDKLA